MKKIFILFREYDKGEREYYCGLKQQGIMDYSFSCYLDQAIQFDTESDAVAVRRGLEPDSAFYGVQEMSVFENV